MSLSFSTAIPRENRLRWRSVSFVGSNKLVLMGVFKEMGIKLQPSAKRAVTSFPDRFLDWRDQYLTPPPG